MTIRNTILPGLIIALMWPTLACGGSEVAGDAGGGTDATSGDDTTTPPASLGSTFLDCVGANSGDCYGAASDCLASDTCSAGLECMSVCSDAVCAADCLAAAGDDGSRTGESAAYCQSGDR